MDHRISKDMISSGMIPSGEKKQEDLSRTQYGTAPSPNALSDVYKSMYEKKEETLNEHHKKDADGNTIPHEDEELKEGAGLYANIHAKRKRGGKMRKKGAKGAPSSQDFANAAKTAKEDVEVDEAVVSGTLAALKLLGTKAAKLGVKAGAKLGGKTGANMMKSVARNPMGAIDNINRVGYAAQTVGSMMPKGVPAVTKKQSQSGMVSADVDLFDIVKGQLLDEGLSEEEIKDIMLTLTPDEIMSEMAVNPNIAAMDAKNKADMIARAQANKVPDKVREASKRQMKAGTPREDKNNPYTTQDKKTIIDYNKNK